MTTSRKSKHKPKNIFFLVSEYQGCAWYRCHVPGFELKRQGNYVVLEHQIDRNALELFDVIIFQRQIYPVILDAINYANSLGKLTVYELDDDLWHLDRNNPAFDYWNNEERLRAAEACIRACQIVTTTTVNLAKQLSKFNPNVVVLPNMLPGYLWNVKPRRQTKERVKVGWAGSNSHWSDLELITDLVEQLLNEFPQVEIHLAGMSEYPFKDHERMIKHQSVRIEELAGLIKNFDIGLAPLVDSPFNRGKSDLKFLEYGMAWVPFIGNKVEPYIHSVEHSKNGFLANNAKDWLKYTRRLIEDVELRVKISKAAHEYALSRTIERNVWMWEKAYQIEGWEETRQLCKAGKNRIQLEAEERDKDEVPPITFPLAQFETGMPRRLPDKKVSIVMLTFNKLHYTKNCLEQLKKVTDNYELVVVDNASTDGTVEYLKQIGWTDVKLITNKENVGFAAGCNQGVEAASNELVCLLNNDTYPLAGWLDALVVSLEPGVGAVGGKLMFPNGRVQHVGIAFDEGLKPFHPYYGAPYELIRESPYPLEVPGVTAACLLTTKAIWKEVGGMDTGYLGGQYEDVDFNLKLHQRGYRVIYQPRAVLVHYEHASFGQGALADTSMQNNLQRLLKKWGPILVSQIKAAR